MIRRPPRSTQSRSSAASDVYKRQALDLVAGKFKEIIAKDGPDAIAGVSCARSINEDSVSYTHLRAHETVLDIVCRLLLEKKNYKNTNDTHKVRIQKRQSRVLVTKQDRSNALELRAL